jgi:glutamate synthase domain-containing protein 1
MEGGGQDELDMLGTHCETAGDGEDSQYDKHAVMRQAGDSCNAEEALKIGTRNSRV